MNRAVATYDASPSAPRILFLLLSYFISGGQAYRVVAPSTYTALQGHLTATVYLNPPPTSPPRYTWDENNGTFVLSTSTGSNGSDSSTDKKPILNGEESQHNDDASRESPEDPSDPFPPLPLLSVTRDDGASDGFSAGGTDEGSHLTLSLFAQGNSEAIETYYVSGSVDRISFVFPCGLIVQGGIHFFRLQRGDQILATSNEVDVSWPQIVLSVPEKVETYHTYVSVAVSFTGSACRPESNINFHVWVDLLYHGVPVGMGEPINSTTMTSKMSVNSNQKMEWNRFLWNSLQEDRNRRALRRFRNILKEKRKEARREKRRGRRVGRKRRGRKKEVYDVSGKSSTSGINGTVEGSVVSVNFNASGVTNDSTKTIVKFSSTNITNLASTPAPHVNITEDNGRGTGNSGVNVGRKDITEGNEGGRKRKRKKIRCNSENQEERKKCRIHNRRRGYRYRQKGKVGQERKVFNRFLLGGLGDRGSKDASLRIPILKANNLVPESISNSGPIKDQSMKSRQSFKPWRNVNRGTESEDLQPSLSFPTTESVDISHSTKFDDPMEETLPGTLVTDSYVPRSDYDEVSPGEVFPDSQMETFSTWDSLTGSSVTEVPVTSTVTSSSKSTAPVQYSPSTERIPYLIDHNTYSETPEKVNTNDFELEIPEELPIDEEMTLFQEPKEMSLIPEHIPRGDSQHPFIPDEIPDLWTVSSSVQEGQDYLSRQRRAYHTPALRHPPQGSIVSSGSRGRGWAWGGGAVILGKAPLGTTLYSKHSRVIQFPCTDIGPAGLYSVRLASNVSSSPVIASSKWFTVIWSNSFSLYVQRKSIRPCNTPVTVQLRHPTCIGNNDKIRVFKRVRANVTSVNPPIANVYMTERRVTKGKTSVQFPCDIFDEGANEFCFVYVNTAKTGAVSEVRDLCIPTYKKGIIQNDGQWSSWSKWTDCTSSCGSGQRLRHRFCDSPAPRNGGMFCKGDSIESIPCELPECVEPSLYPPPASTPGGEQCGCGCILELPSGVTTTVTASAADCTGTAKWVLQAPPGEHVVAEVAWAALRPGYQWLKLRDGDSLSSPLLVRLPASVPTANSDSFSGRLAHVPPRTSTGSRMILEFRSDINVTSATINPATWGFFVNAFPRAASLTSDVLYSGVTEQKRSYWGLLGWMHMAAVVFISALVAAVIVLAVYHWRRYRLYKRARLIPESPYMTPPGTPSREIETGASTLTLTEVISLKSLIFRPKIPVSLPLKRKGSATSYSALDERQPEEPHHSLPNSPFLTRRAVTPSSIRRSSSQLGRFLRRGSGNFKKKKRRYGSADELESRCISPIHETHKEDDGGGVNGKEEPSENANKMGEEGSVKYKEYRKSLGDTKDLRLPHKLVKDRMNLERLRRSAISRSNSNATMRGSSSVSELSVNGTDTEMEYDYYDYDMDNASAVPGSMFGMDPLLLAWVPDFIPIGEQCTPPDEGIPLEEIVHASTNDTDATTPTAEQPTRPNELPLEHMNIPHVDDKPPANPMEISIRSEEANDRVELQLKPPEVPPEPPYEDDDPTPTTEFESKILNLDDEDFQFADDTDDELEDL